jgi:hypothetical protein
MSSDYFITGAYMMSAKKKGEGMSANFGTDDWRQLFLFGTDLLLSVDSVKFCRLSCYLHVEREMSPSAPPVDRSCLLDA